MNSLAQKQILLGVTGGIAAYKSADLVRRLQDRGADVRVVMTPGAEQFVQPLTFQALSGHRVYRHLFDNDSGAMEHIDLARWADAILIAPTTAHFLAKLANGLGDDLLSTICLASDKPLAVAPAMNRQMWAHPATRENVQCLQQRGTHILGPAEGDQACGETGEGRILEPLQLVDALESLFQPPILKGINITITAGPTREALDPVRYISNRSSGKMGYALAQAAQQLGARVTLVSGPVSIEPPAGVNLIPVTTAEEMYQAVMQGVDDADIFIGAAAVADYRAAHPAAEKIKKHDVQLSFELVRNPDILSEVSQRFPRPFCVGFAAETENLEDNALAKLEKKQLDMIAANWVGEQANEQQTGFDSDDNTLHVYTQNSDTLLRKTSKTKIARQLIELIAEKYYETNPTENP